MIHTVALSGFTVMLRVDIPNKRINADVCFVAAGYARRKPSVGEAYGV